jgi:hypothetical protein
MDQLKRKTKGRLFKVEKTCMRRELVLVKTNLGKIQTKISNMGSNPLRNKWSWTITVQLCNSKMLSKTIKAEIRRKEGQMVPKTKIR